MVYSYNLTLKPKPKVPLKGRNLMILHSTGYKLNTQYTKHSISSFFQMKVTDQVIARKKEEYPAKEMLKLQKIVTCEDDLDKVL